MCLFYHSEQQPQSINLHAENDKFLLKLKCNEVHASLLVWLNGCMNISGASCHKSTVAGLNTAQED